MLLRWALHARPPEDWDALVTRLGGGFFHSPAAAEMAQGGSAPFYAVGSSDGGAQVAASVCVRWRCRLSPFRRHARLLTLPALGSGPEVSVSGATRSLVAALSDVGVAEVVVDSFDAEGVLQPEGPIEAGVGRTEFRVDIGPERTDDELLMAMKSSHRRKVRSGESNGWELRPFAGREASSVLARVQAAAVERHVRLSRPTFRTGEPEAVETSGEIGRLPPCGSQVFGAVAGEEVLSAAWIGWGGERAFYLVGGSTPAGYEEAAAFWMHWAIMQRLRNAGLSVYNLGGTPAGAAERGHAQHGLHRFKEGFGSRLVTCGGGHATLRPGHARRHAFARWIGSISSMRKGSH